MKNLKLQLEKRKIERQDINFYYYKIKKNKVLINLNKISSLGNAAAISPSSADVSRLRWDSRGGRR